MKMADDNLELAYRDGILQALKETKYEKRRIDDYVDSDKISPRILKEIRRSDIVIADLTGERQNCYYEVGYCTCYRELRHTVCKACSKRSCRFAGSQLNLLAKRIRFKGQINYCAEIFGATEYNSLSYMIYNSKPSPLERVG